VGVAVTAGVVVGKVRVLVGAGDVAVALGAGVNAGTGITVGVGVGVATQPLITAAPQNRMIKNLERTLPSTFYIAEACFEFYQQIP
jgi:hypothetical protein